jgi:hypothetical protein
MTGWRSDLATFLAGTVAGAVVLGLGGRAAMAVLSIVNGNRPEFSWGGSPRGCLTRHVLRRSAEHCWPPNRRGDADRVIVSIAADVVADRPANAANR